MIKQSLPARSLIGDADKNVFKLVEIIPPTRRGVEFICVSLTKNVLYPNKSCIINHYFENLPIVIFLKYLFKRQENTLGLITYQYF